MQNLHNNQSNAEVEFLRDSQSTDLFIRALEFASWKFLAITTAIFAWNFFKGQFDYTFTGKELVIARITGVFLFYLIIDAGLQNKIKYYFRQKLGGQKANVGMKMKFVNHIFILIIIRFLATTTSSIWAAPTLGKALTRDKESHYYLAEMDKRDSLKRLEIEEQKALIADLKAEASAGIQSSSVINDARVQSVIAKGDQWQRASFEQDGFGWLTSKANKDSKDHKYAASIRAAMDAAIEARTLQSEKVNAAQSELSKIINDSTHHQAIDLIATLALDDMTEVNQEEEHKTNYVFLFDFLAAFLALWSTRLVVIREIAGKVPVKQKSFTSTLSHAFNQFQDGLLDFLENLLGIDINGDKQIGGNSQQKQSGISVSNNPENSVYTHHETIEIAQEETAQQIVPQYRNSETTDKETVAKHIRETTILQAPSVDLSQWKKYFNTYFRRTLKKGSAPETIARNWDTAMEYMELINNSGIEKIELIYEGNRAIDYKVIQIKRTC